MQRGVVYQGRLQDYDGRWSDYPDFLVRVDAPSALSGWSYEVLDAKLARVAKGEALLQLLLYSDLLAQVQGTRPAWMHLALGRSDGPTEASFRVVEYSAYYRAVRRRFEAHAAEQPETYRSRSTIVRSATGSRAVRIADTPTITCRWSPGSRAASGVSWSTGA